MHFLLGWNELHWLYIFWSSYLSNPNCFSSLIDTGMFHSCKVPCLCSHSLQYSRNLWKNWVIMFIFWIVVMHNQQNADCWFKNLINQICNCTKFKLIALLSMILHISQIAYTVVKRGHTEGIEREKIRLKNPMVLPLIF